MNWLRQTITVFMVVAAIASVSNRAIPQTQATVQAAFADRSKYPKEDWWFIYYMDTDPWVGAEKDDLVAGMRLIMASATLNPVIERTTPTPIPGTSLHRIDLRELGWDAGDFNEVAKRYPYRDTTKYIPLVYRADWFTLQLADQQESNAYPLLLYGSKNPPKNRDDILARLNVVNKREHVFGIIEGKSGVAKQGTRWIESRPILRGYAWGTRDALNLKSDRDPLEHPDGSQVHDGEEWIIGIPKISATYGTRGTLQIYFLANGQGQLVNRAPVDLVEDSTKFRGYAEIRTPGSCIQCHKSGLNTPTANLFRELSEGGVFPFVSDPAVARDLQAFHMSDIKKELERANDDYQTIVELITGLPSPAAAEAFQRAVNRYDKPLDMLAAAEEFVPYGIEVDDFVAALEQAANEGKIGARLAGLTRNKTIPREAWEEQFLIVGRLLKQRSNQ